MSKEYWSVDRIENGSAVLENDQRERIQLPLNLLPAGVLEGNVLEKAGESYRIDEQETARRREEAIRLQNQLFQQ